MAHLGSPFPTTVEAVYIARIETLENQLAASEHARKRLNDFARWCLSKEFDSRALSTMAREALSPEV